MAVAPSSPTPAKFKVETDIEVEATVGASLTVYVDDVQNHSSPPNDNHLPERPSPSLTDEIASAYSGFQSRQLSPVIEETTSKIGPFILPPIQGARQNMSPHIQVAQQEEETLSPEVDNVLRTVEQFEEMSTTRDDGDAPFSSFTHYHQVFRLLTTITSQCPTSRRRSATYR
jgi:hypothetical protein